MVSAYVGFICNLTWLYCVTQQLTPIIQFVALSTPLAALSRHLPMSTPAVKIAVLGPKGSGKTTFVTHVTGKPSPALTSYTPTAGVRIITVPLPPDVPVTAAPTATSAAADPAGPLIEVWDCSGDPEYESCWPAIMDDLDGAVVVFNPADSSQAADARVWGEWFCVHAGLVRGQAALLAVTDDMGMAHEPLVLRYVVSIPLFFFLLPLLSVHVFVLLSPLPLCPPSSHSLQRRPQCAHRQHILHAHPRRPQRPRRRLCPCSSSSRPVDVNSDARFREDCQQRCQAKALESRADAGVVTGTLAPAEAVPAGAIMGLLTLRIVGCASFWEHVCCRKCVPAGDQSQTGWMPYHRVCLPLKHEHCCGPLTDLFPVPPPRVVNTTKEHPSRQSHEWLQMDKPSQTL